jgi:signal transduction histidine kinase
MPQQNDLRSDEGLRATAHDLKNELASILALAEMIEVLLPENQRENVAPHIQKMRERIKNTSEKISETFRQLRSQ